MIRTIRRLLGFESNSEKVSTLLDIDSRLGEISTEISELAHNYTRRYEAKNEVLKSMSDDFIVTEITTRFDLFEKSHLNELLPLKKEKDSLEYERLSILKSKEVSELYQERQKFNIIKSKYKSGEISTELYNIVLKAKEGKVKYSDILVFNKSGELLVLKRAKTDESQPEKWGLPGGHVDLGESHLTAAKRELLEETGLNINKSELTNIGKFEDKDVCIEYYKAVDVCIELNPIILQSDEHWGCKWINISELDNYDMPFNMKDNIKKVLGIEETEKKTIKSGINDFKGFIEPFLKAFNEGEISADTLKNVIEKARTHKYIRKTPDGKGGWNYVYEEKEGNEGKTALENALNKVEKEIVTLDYEHGYCFNKDGKELFNQKGGVGKIVLSDENLRKLKGNTFTHNHPSWKKYDVLRKHGVTLSLDDIIIACKYGAKEMRCVSGKYFYSLSKKDGSNFNTNDYIEVRKEILKGLDDVKKEIDINSMRPVDEMIAIHIINSKLYNNKIYNYKSEKL